MREVVLSGATAVEPVSQRGRSALGVLVLLLLGLMVDEFVQLDHYVIAFIEDSDALAVVLGAAAPVRHIDSTVRDC